MSTKKAKTMETRIQESKLPPWCKRLFLFFLEEGAKPSKEDIKGYTKNIKQVMQKKKEKSSSGSLATMSFVVWNGDSRGKTTKRLPALKAEAEKCLQAISYNIKKYGEIMWYVMLMRDSKLFVLFSFSNAKGMSTFLKDYDSKSIHQYFIRALNTDLTRGHSDKFKPGDTVQIKFNQADIEETRALAEEEAAHASPQAVTQELREEEENKTIMDTGRVAPYEKGKDIKQGDEVEVFSKTHEIWVSAKVVCVQEDAQGVFVTVVREDGHELDYDLKYVRAPEKADKPTEPQPSKPQDPSVGQEQEQAEEAKADNEPDAGAAGGGPEMGMLTEEDLMKKIEIFHVLDKIRSVKMWLEKMMQENEGLPNLIQEELGEVAELLNEAGSQAPAGR